MIEADDSAGRPLSQACAGHAAAGDRFGGGGGSGAGAVAGAAQASAGGRRGRGAPRAGSMTSALLDLALRGPRPAGGLAGLDAHLSDDKAGAERAWRRVRPRLDGLAGLTSVARWPIWPRRLVARRDTACWRPRMAGAAGRAAAELLSRVQGSWADAGWLSAADDAVPMLRQLLDERPVRPPYGGHPRVFIWGLLEARLQQADLMILGGLNEGVWPALPAPDPWLAPKIRANLGLPGLEFRIGLAAHDFASALGAPAGADHARAARQPLADRRLAPVAEAAGDDRRPGARHEARAACRWRSTIRGVRSPADRPAPEPPNATSGRRRSRSRRSTGSRPIHSHSMPRRSSACAASIRSMPTIAPPGRAPPSTRFSRMAARGRLRSRRSCVAAGAGAARQRDHPSRCFAPCGSRG